MSLPWGLFFFLASFWGTSYLVIKQVVSEWPPLFGAATRVFISLAFLFVFTRVTRKSTRIPRQQFVRVWIAGLFSQAIPFGFLYWGQSGISGGLSGILNGTVPLWTFLLGLVYAGGLEKFTWRRLSGILLGFFGLAVIFSPLLRGGESTRSQLWSALALIAMAIAYGLGGLITRELLNIYKIDFWGNLFHQTVAAVVFLFTASATFDVHWPSVEVFFHPRPFMASIYLGVISSSLGWIIYFFLIREWGAVRASTVTYVVPLTAMFWDYVFVKSTPRGSELWGIAFILLGVVLIQIPRFPLFSFSNR